MKKLFVLVLFSFNLSIFCSDEMISQELVDEFILERLDKELDEHRISPIEIVDTDIDMITIVDMTLTGRLQRISNLWDNYQSIIRNEEKQQPFHDYLYFCDTDKDKLKAFREELLDAILKKLNQSLFRYNSMQLEKYFLITVYNLLTPEQQAWINIATDDKTYDPEEFIKLLSNQQKEKLQILHDPKEQKSMRYLTQEEQLYFNNLLLLIPKKS